MLIVITVFCIPIVSASIVLQVTFTNVSIVIHVTFLNVLTGKSDHTNIVTVWPLLMFYGAGDLFQCFNCGTGDHYQYFNCMVFTNVLNVVNLTFVYICSIVVHVTFSVLYLWYR
jgi:hypothetical protein